MISVHCFSKGFLILFGQLYFKQSSTARIKRLMQLHYAHSQVTSRRHTRIYLLVVDEYGYDLLPHEVYGTGRGRKRICSWTKKGYYTYW